LELSKGKLTSDEKHHSGEGIFFTSRMFDGFSIRSGNLFYRRKRSPNDWGWLIETDDIVEPFHGTCVAMRIPTNADWTAQEVFARYTVTEEDDGVSLFVKTHIPISLAKHGTEQLVSRSQAKRLLARFEKFKEVMLDFTGVSFIGQGFADEIFRVFRIEHPEVSIVSLGATPEIERMIAHVQSERNDLVSDQPTLFSMLGESGKSRVV
jgi:hypothetical protein